MKIAELFSKNMLPRALRDVLEGAGYGTLYPPQAEALRSGVLEGKNLVLSVPTAAGKTLVAEICMVKSVLEKRGRCLYVVPLRALASEKHDEFKKRYAPLGISVGVATGEYDMPGNRLGKFDILIATSEKVDSLLRLRTPWLAESLAVAVLDEIHYIHDPSRGPTLEVVAARLRQVNPSLQVLALSATISNGRELASWLDAALVSSDWRPVPLREGVYDGSRIHYSDHRTRSLVGARREPVPALVADTLDEGGQALVFVNSRRSTQAVARLLAPFVAGRLTPKEKSLLREAAGAAESVLQEPTHICRELAGAIRSGVAFHHAGLHQEQRRLVEGAFRANLLKAICATPTLAAGVNLPARRVVIRDWCRYQAGGGMQAIPVFEYKQFAGRAGRPGYDCEGDAILVAKKEGEREILFEHYVSAAIEPLESQLGSGGALASHVLASIASGYAGTLGELMDFFSLTFFAVQEDVRSLSLRVERIVRFLLDEGLITAAGEDASSARLSPTPFGDIVSRLYLEPASGITLRKGLLALGGGEPKSDAVLHLICCCPDMDCLSVGRANGEELRMEAEVRGARMLIPFPWGEEFSREARWLQALRTANMLGDWIEEAHEDKICEAYGVGPGDVRRFVESADWLLYAAQRIAGLLGIADARQPVENLRRRVLYGIKEELLELVSLKGIGRVRARNLFKKGYRSLAHIRKATARKLAAVPSIGPQIAASIKKQLV